MNDTREGRTAGLRFIEALRSNAFDDLESLLDREVGFRALLPSGVRVCTGRVATADYFRAWFGPVKVERLQADGKPYPFKETTSCQVVEGVVGAPVEGRIPIRYRLELRNSAGHCRCEQQGFYTVNGDGKLATLDVVCSGILPVAD